MASQSDTQLSARDYWSVLKRRGWSFGAGAGLVALAGIALAYRLPPVYESTGVLLAEQPEVPEYVVRSTVPNYPEERVRVITQRVLTAENLRRIVEQHDVYPQLAGSMNEALSRLREDLTLSSEEPALLENLIGADRAADAIAFSIAFGHTDPAVARDVARALVDLYLEENQRARREQAAATAEFLTGEAARLEEEIAVREGRLADFKEANAASLPEVNETNRELLDRTERDLRDVDREIRSLRERQTLYSAQLAELNAYAPIVNERGETVLDPADRLKVLQRTYLQLSAVYSDDHPDVAKLRREIQALSDATGAPAFDRQAIAVELALREDELADARSRYSDDHPDVQRLQRTIDGLERTLAAAQAPAPQPRALSAPPDNPAYIERQVQLDALSAELDAAFERREELRARLDELEGSLVASPEVERQFNALNRGYEQLLTQHAEVQAKLREAETALNLESSLRGERFTVLAAPSRPSRPVRPNRLAMLMLTLVVAVGVGAAIVALREHGDDTLRNARDVTAYLEIPPIVTIPRVQNQDDVRQRRWNKLIGVTAVGVWASLIAFFVMTPAT